MQILKVVLEVDLSRCARSGVRVSQSTPTSVPRGSQPWGDGRKARARYPRRARAAAGRRGRRKSISAEVVPGSPRAGGRPRDGGLYEPPPFRQGQCAPGGTGPGAVTAALQAARVRRGAPFAPGIHGMPRALAWEIAGRPLAVSLGRG